MRGMLGREWRRRKEEAVAAPLRLAFVAGAVDGFMHLTVVDAARRASGKPSLWTSASGDASPFGPRERAVSLSVKVADVACDVLADGRTPGRAIAGIRLERDSGRPLDLETAVIREFADYGTTPVLWLPMRVLLRGTTGATSEERARVGIRVFGVAGAITVARIAARAADPQKRSLEDRIARTRLVRSRPRAAGLSR